MCEDIAKTIGKRIRKIRREKGLTLEKLHMRTRISVSMISKIENSQTFPPISTYAKIASALGTSIGELIIDSGQNTDISIVRAVERSVISQGPYMGSPLAYKKEKKKMEPFLFGYPVRKSFPNPLHQHKQEEMAFIIKGAIEFKYGEKTIVLKKGDCIYYDGNVPHGARALNSQGATAIVVQSNE